MIRHGYLTLVMSSDRYLEGFNIYFYDSEWDSEWDLPPSIDELKLMDWLSQYGVDICPCGETKFLLKVDTNNFQRLSNDLTALENNPSILKDNNNG